MPRVNPNTGRSVAVRRLVPLKSNPYYSQSLDRGLAILACFTAVRPVLGIADIADALGMSHSTTHRYASTLVELGYLEKTRARKYTLGPKVCDLAMGVLSYDGLRERAWPHMQRLCEEHPTGLVTVSVLDKTEVVCLASTCTYPGRVDPELRIRAGSRLPAYCTAAGKVLLAALTPPARRQIITQLKLHAYTASTIKRKRRMQDELNEIAANDLIAVCDEELAPHLRAIAAPIMSACQVIGALELSIHDQRLSRTSLTARYASELLQTVQHIGSATATATLSSQDEGKP